LERAVLEALVDLVLQVIRKAVRGAAEEQLLLEY
jgi:hypothetical protein